MRKYIVTYRMAQASENGEVITSVQAEECKPAMVFDQIDAVLGLGGTIIAVQYESSVGGLIDARFSDVIADMREA